jgi:hypothetical protein
VVAKDGVWKMVRQGEFKYVFLVSVDCLRADRVCCISVDSEEFQGNDCDLSILVGYNFFLKQKIPVNMRPNFVL